MVLVSFWLFLRPPEQRRVWSWPLFLFIVSLFSLYLFLIAACVWAADWARRLIEHRRPLGPLAIEAIAAPALVLLGLWQTGFFLLANDAAASGFGHFRADVFTFIDPYSPLRLPARGEFTGPIIWSYFMPDIGTDPGHNGEYEGFAFAGVGLILLVAFAGWLFFRTRRTNTQPLLNAPNLRYLLVVIFGMALFALSNHISFGPYTIDSYVPFAALFLLFGLAAAYVLLWPHRTAILAFTKARPKALIAAAIGVVALAGLALLAVVMLPRDTLVALLNPILEFRSTGRFINLLFFAIAFVAILIVAQRLPARQALLVLIAAFVVQAVDTSAGWLHMRSNLNRYGDQWQTKLVSPFWDEAAARYPIIRQDWAHEVPNLTDFGLLAYRHGGSTDITYLVRLNTDVLEEFEAAHSRLCSKWRLGERYALPARSRG